MKTMRFAPLALLIFAAALSSPQERQAKSWNEYYPLSKDNAWKYVVVDKTTEKPREFVTWKVLNLSRNSQGAVFAVWPTTAQSDDDGMQLQFTSDGLKELGNNFYILRFPVVKGSNWSTEGGERVFKVISEGEPCAVGKYKFARCAVVQDDDREARLRTLTTYAFGVGPVRYEYRTLDGGETGGQVTQVMKIISYSVK